jgi:hypothetical protein
MRNAIWANLTLIAVLCEMGCADSTGGTHPSDSDTDTDTDTDIDSDSDSDTDTDTDLDTDTDSDTDSDSDTSYGGCDDIDTDFDAGTPGEWADPDSGLIWQNPPYGEGACWDAAVEYCEALGNGWRLPNINELRSLIRGCPQNELGGECGLSDPDCLDGSCTDGCVVCESLQGPGNSGCYWDAELRGSCLPSPEYNYYGVYWSSSKEPKHESTVWNVDFSQGSPDVSWTFNSSQAIRCVRDGK